MKEFFGYITPQLQSVRLPMQQFLRDVNFGCYAAVEKFYTA
jgi:hypothetical protein